RRGQGGHEAPARPVHRLGGHGVVGEVGYAAAEHGGVLWRGPWPILRATRGGAVVLHCGILAGLRPTTPGEPRWRAHSTSARARRRCRSRCCAKRATPCSSTAPPVLRSPRSATAGPSSSPS